MPPGRETYSISSPARLVAPDFLRGVAVLGIVYANIVAFAHPLIASIWPGGIAGLPAAGDEAVWLSNFMIVDGRMRGLFSILFGASLVLFARTAPANLQLRRLAWLALFGAAHYFLLFRGDILFSYAVCGALAVPLLRLEAARLVVLGLMLYLLGAVMLGALYWPEVVAEARFLQDCGGWERCIEARPADPVGLQYHELISGIAAEGAAMRASLAAVLRFNLNQAHGLIEGALFSFTETLPLMLIGMGLFKAGLLGSGPGEDELLRSPALLASAVIAIGVGLALLGPLALWLTAQGHPLYLTLFVGTCPAALARLPVIVGLAVLLARLAPAAARTAVGRRLVCAGRTAFTNYIGTSLLMAFVFQGWGLGWHGQLSRAELLVVVMATWATMLAWSPVWLARFGQGPLEQLWRRLTGHERRPAG